MTHGERYEAIVQEYNGWAEKYDMALALSDYGIMSLCAFMSNAIVAAVARSHDPGLKMYFQGNVTDYFH